MRAEQNRVALLVDAQEAAAITGIPVSTLHSWAAARDRGAAIEAPRHVRISDRRRLWERAELLAWIDARRV